MCHSRIFWLSAIVLITSINQHAKSNAEVPPGLQEAYQQARQQTFLSIKDNRFIYDRDNIKEWYINDPKGLEQGITGQRIIRIAVRTR